MILGARTGSWAKSGGGVLTARDYVQDGLIAMWDGIENTGWGAHDPNATVWKDLVGEYDLSVGTRGLWLSNALESRGGGAVRTDSYFTPKTVECAFKVITRAVSPVLNIGQVVVGFYNLDVFASNIPRVFQRLGEEVDGISFSVVTSIYSYGLRINDRFGWDGDTGTAWSDRSNICIGNRDFGSGNVIAEYYNVRCYDRYLSNDESAANYAIDKARFNLP